MSMRHWIRNMFDRPGIRPNRRAHRVSLAFDKLEDRCVPATFTVNNTRDDGSAGSLRWAVGQANAFMGDDEIVFDNAVFGTPQTIALAGTQLELHDEFGKTTVTGPSVGVTVDAGGASRVLLMPLDSWAVISNLTFRGGHAATGGGLHITGFLTLVNCTITGNTADGNGGGLLFYDGAGSIVLNNCTVSGNRAGASNNTYGNGGGIVNYGFMYLTNCTISGNVANAGSFYPGNGGGLWNAHALNLANCAVSGNTAANDGGGVFNYSGTVAMTDSTVSGNSAVLHGGGIFNINVASATVNLTRCTISGNTAVQSGGGIRNNGTMALVNCTISGNTADPQFVSPGAGGGIAQYGPATLTNCTIAGNTGTNGGGMLTGTTSNVTTNMINTIVAGNSARREAPDIDGPVNSLGFNLIGITDGNSGWVSTDLTGTSAQPLDPLLGPLGNNGGPTETMALRRGSPAIKKGTTVAGITTDQRNLPVDNPPDIGAFQTQVPTTPAPLPGFAVGAGAGGTPLVNVYDGAGALIRVIQAYQSTFRGGVHVATADVNGDDIPDLITAPGFGGGPVIRIWDGETGTLESEFNAYDPLFRGGTNIAVVKLLNALGPPQIITGPGPNGGPHVKVFDSQTQAALASFLAYDPSFRGGISVAANAATQTGPGQIITGAGPGGGPHVRTFSATGAPQGPGFMAYDIAFVGGVNVAALGSSNIMTAPASSGASVVRQFNLTGDINQQFLAYDAAFFGGVSLGVIPFGSGSAILTGAGPGGGPHVKAFETAQFSTPVLSFTAFDPAFTGGVFVG